MGHTLVAKSIMTFVYGDARGLKNDPEAMKKAKASQRYQRVAAAQVNEAEYAPVLIAGLLFTTFTISGHFATLGVDPLASLQVKVQTSQGVDSALAL